LGIRDFFTKTSKSPRGDSVQVLVCSLNPEFDDLLKADGEVYLRSYPSTVVTACGSIADLIQAMKGKDIVHVFADVSPLGLIRDESGAEVSGTDLIRAAGDADVKLLWIASDNKPEGYIKGFKPVKPLNLVMTIDRKGPNFTIFLSQLLSRLSNGEKMPVAWAALAPQTTHDPLHNHLPGTIFSAGRGNVSFC
jgi:hypothetical protein